MSAFFLSTLVRSAPATVYWRPVSMVSSYSISSTPSGTSTPNTMNEEVADDNNYVNIGTSTNNGGLTTVLGGTTPGVLTGAVLTVRAKRPSGFPTMSVQLGAVSYGSIAVTNSWVDYTFAVTQAQAEAWNLGDLRLTVTSSASFNSRTVQVSWVELKINPPS